MIYYINAEPHELTASIRLDDDPWAPTIIPGTGTQHIEFDIPKSEYGHGATLRSEAPGYQSDERRVQFLDDPWLADLTLTPAAPVGLPRLVVNGQFFALETGERWTAIQCSDFHLFGRFLNGEDITPILQQRADLGFNLLRVWTRYDLSQYGIGTCTLAQHPDLYDRLPAFLDLCASYGLYVELTAYTGREDYDVQHWGRLGDAALKAKTLPLMELVNEQDQPGNHINLAPFAPLVGLLCSHGSNGSEQEPVTPYWNYATFHTNGAFEWQRKNGHNAMELWAGPTITNESTRGTDRDNNAAHFEDAAKGAALLCAGSCCHLVHGKSSELFDDGEIVLAQAHVRGAKSVPLGCQPFPYRHRSDLEGGSYLRVYQRGSEPVCIVTIRP